MENIPGLGEVFANRREQEVRQEAARQSKENIARQAAQKYASQASRQKAELARRLTDEVHMTLGALTRHHIQADRSLINPIIDRTKRRPARQYGHIAAYFIRDAESVSWSGTDNQHRHESRYTNLLGVDGNFYIRNRDSTFGGTTRWLHTETLHFIGDTDQQQAGFEIYYSNAVGQLATLLLKHHIQP